MAAAAALSLLGDATLYTVLPSHYIQIGLTPLQVGILLSVHRCIRLISNHLADKCYRHFPVIFFLAPAFLVASLVTLSYGYFQIFVILLIARIFWGVCFSFIRQAMILTATSASSIFDLGKRMGLNRSISMTGWLFGTLLGGFGCDYFGWTFTLIAFGLISLASTPLSILSQKEIHSVHTAAPKAGVAPLDYKLMICGFTMGIVGFGLIISTFGLVVKEQIGSSPYLMDNTVGVATITGAVLAVRWGLDILGSPMLGALADRIGRQRSLPVIFMIGSSALGLACLPFGVVWLTGCILVVFLCDALLGIVVASWAGQQGGRSVADYATGMDFGMALGPLIGWSIAEFGLPSYTIFLAGAAFYTFGVFVARPRHDPIVIKTC